LFVQQRGKAKKIEALLKQMTVDEKVGRLNEFSGTVMPGIGVAINHPESQDWAWPNMKMACPVSCGGEELVSRSRTTLGLPVTQDAGY
jgi:hypothetical protein